MEIILSVIGGLISLLLAIIGSYVRKADRKIDTLNNQMGDFAIGQSTLNERLISTTKEISDIKSNFSILENNLEKKINDQFKYVIENRERIVKLEVMHDNCPALAQFKKG